MAPRGKDMEKQLAVEKPPEDMEAARRRTKPPKEPCWRSTLTSWSRRG